MFMFRDTLPKMEGYIRFINSCPDNASGQGFDIYVDDKKVLSDFKFGSVTAYLTYLPGNRNVKVYSAGTTEKPLSDETYEISPLSTSTIAIANDGSEFLTFSLDDSMVSNPMFAYVRFINLSPEHKLLNLSLPGGSKSLFDETSYLEETNYYPVSPGIYNFVVSDNGNFSKFISNVNLTEDMYITIYIIGSDDSDPQIGYVLLKDGMSRKK